MPNRLADATSPYLLQHADNPVDWWPWSAEAFEEARRRDVPILLSVGYSACHWCHVMERESFEDERTAALMNSSFVPIKVDREERPDVDSVYMDAVQAMTGQGGWPMTVFCTPEGRPFYAGTYFPPTDRFGMPSFGRVLTGIAAAWSDRRDDIEAQSGELVEHLAKAAGLSAPVGGLGADLLEQAFAALEQSFDSVWGGVGTAPKFPQPMTLEFVLRCRLRGFAGADTVLETTLDRMAAGGMYDQLGGGFHRYSTDQRWQVPHFEKMLYDNAQLAKLYLHAFQLTRTQRYEAVVTGTLDYMLRELRQPDGGFSSSADADSEGEEGRFFVWSYDELAGIAGPAVAAWYGATPKGNWEGANVLWCPRPLEEVADEQGVDAGELARQVAEATPKLLEARERRVRPATDDKVLAAWNGLAISALAEAGRVLDRPDYVRAAVAAADFVLTSLRTADGRLARTWREGHAGGAGYADDHALMAEACLTLYETTFELRWLETARALTGTLLERFADERGGFFQTAADAEALVVRPKELFDNAVPSGNSAAAEVLVRLALLTGEAAYEAAAARALGLVAGIAGRAPTAVGTALCAMDTYVGPAQEIAIVGDPADPFTRELIRAVWARPDRAWVLAVARPGDSEAALVAPLVADRPQLGGRPTAYVCRRFTCRRPVTDPAELAAQLAS